MINAAGFNLEFVRIHTFFRKLSFAILFLATAWPAFSQERCGTVEYTSQLLKNNVQVEDQGHFEKWLQQKIKTRAQATNTQRTQSAPYQIPVVVHVVHFGEALGVGRNIPDEQIISQISVLNQDYKRLNGDAGNTPAEFQPVAGSLDIEFVLARQDPEGLATNGIVRVKGSKTSWSINDNYELKALSYWPAEDYLNIWVCDLTSLLGYAQFPISNLAGLENSSSNRLTDGVVIAFDAFGSTDDGNFSLLANFAKGRSATHEIGHFFGLRHIWGDDESSCSGTDYVDDTPNQSGSSTGCPVQPLVTCTVHAMFQNYMDYSYDNCMNLFTAGQVDRMINVIENSPRRLSLLTSHGLNNPAPVANDLGIKTVVSPREGECSTPVLPTLEIRNYGSNNIASARIQLKKNGVPIETKDFTFVPALSPLQTTTVSFSSIIFPGGTSTVAFEVLLTNSTTDGLSTNNTEQQSVAVPNSINIPFLENFNALPSTWAIDNPDQKVTWTLATTPVNGTNKAMVMQFFNYEDNLGEIDLLVTPTFDLSTAPAALLKFDVAYARFQTNNDGLKVVLLNNCNTDVTQGIVLYDKAGSTLATVASATTEFTPSSPEQWRTEQIDLSGYIGQKNLQIAFVGVNDWGNNLYLDNVSLTTTPIYDVALEDVLAPEPVTCQEQTSPVLRVKNSGTLITSLTVNTTLNGTTYTQTINGLSITGGSRQNIPLTAVPLIAGENSITFQLSGPNGQADFTPDDNSKIVKTILNASKDAIPLRENFQNAYQPQWTVANPTGEMLWRPVDISGNKAIFFNAFDNTVASDEAWLVSPTLDFSGATEASLSFDVSYSFRSGKNDVLKVLASKDCGNSFSDTLYVSSGTVLASGRTSTNSWRPAAAADWTNHNLVLSTLAGLTDVRIAFVATNANGNNIYLDNVEFFETETHVASADPFSVYPNPAKGGDANITFNIVDKGPVELEVVDSMGKTLLSENLSGILNQTFALSLATAADGVYVIRVKTSSETHFKKLIVIH
ncbi:T9SS-dependent choice-of-anchor J family protein [Chryseolinea lacunae]|uniref:Choice-of-anchor J domain-containing protein n=1 Tax=Chryseolinea lacunae TaxID=2801331 RepID=A0ABS1KYI9_9BACT|nr:choice-of-anchor J domain-containing protein [Chryseolinea lacunae]MBL0743767.1 choice-of-anchor J domain-containing protein [Chryseolinea lacunae]